jgi:hypothetical protein
LCTAKEDKKLLQVAMHALKNTINNWKNHRENSRDSCRLIADEILLYTYQKKMQEEILKRDIKELPHAKKLISNCSKR